MLKTLKNANVLVTGASEGIGFETARLAAKAGARVLMVARNEQKLRDAAARIPGEHRPEIASVDLSDAAALERFLSDLDHRGFTPDLVVNNAGHGASGGFADDNWSKLDAMVRLNVNALTRITYWAARKMRAQKRGSIVNLSAAVATRPTPHFSSYAATKAFVTNLSVAVNSELSGTGVSIGAVHPPAVKTSFAEPGKADLRSTLVLKLFPPVSPASVARCVLRVAKNGRRTAVVGPIAAIIMATAPIMPRGLDLAFMSLMFRGKRNRSRPMGGGGAAPAHS